MAFTPPPLSTCSGFQVRSAQMKSPIRKNAPGASTIRPLGVYHPPSAASGEHGVAEERARPEDLAEGTHDEQDQPVPEGRCRAVGRLSPGRFCMANASARPMMMQLVMMSPTNTDSCLRDVVQVRLQHLIHHDHERRDDRQLHDDPDVGRDGCAAR
jgi:hypothetical protein